jgi:hypothetical protein
MTPTKSLLQQLQELHSRLLLIERQMHRAIAGQRRIKEMLGS